MNAEDLLKHYERIADAPDAIARLRRFILDLAVRGKMTSYRLGEVEILPLGDLSEFIMGQAPPGNSYNENSHGTVFVKVGEFGERFPVHAAWTTEPLKFAKQGDVLICVVGATIGKLNLAIDCAIGRSVAAIRPQARLDQVFLYYSLMPVTMRLREDSRGTAQGVISRTDLAAIPIWCPPLAEQRRIVAKVDELMGLCDQLEEARNAREAKRERLAAASLARLNAPDPETFPDHASFALNVLPALTSRPDQVKALRQTILNLAVRGKLVPQDPNDEPASELLKRLLREKERLLRAGEIPRDKPIPPLMHADKFFDLPVGWEWVRLGQITKMVTSGSRDWAQHYSTEGAIFVRMGNLSRENYRLRLDNIQYVNPPADGEGTRTRLEAGDILISITGDVGMLGLIPEEFGEAYINQHTAMVRLMDELKGRYLPELFRSPLAQEQFNEPQRGIKNSFRLTDITQLVVPLPPLAEQYRIITKIDRLMGLCDRLEADLSTVSETRSRLLDALLSKALVPTTNFELAESA